MGMVHPKMGINILVKFQYGYDYIHSVQPIMVANPCWEEKIIQNPMVV